MANQTVSEELSITIVFFSTLKTITQQEEAKIKIEKGSTLKDVLIEIQEQFFLPNNARILKADNNSLDVGMICLVNEVDYTLIGGLKHRFQQTPIKITLISSLHGG